MTVYTKTINESRDYILKRIGSEGSSKYEIIVLGLMNKAMVDISQMKDWEFLNKKTEITTTDATGVVSLPADVDRVLAIHAANGDFMLTKVTPYQFEQIKDSSSLTQPRVWTIQGYEQDTSVEPPRIQIEIASEPDTGTKYQLRYIRYLDEIVASSTVVPNIPPFIWELVERKAMIDSLKIMSADDQIIKVEQGSYLLTLDRYLKRDEYGSSQYSEISQRPDVSAHYRNRMRTYRHTTGER